MSRELTVAGLTENVSIPAFGGLDILYVPNVSIQGALGLPNGTEIVIVFYS